MRQRQSPRKPPISVAIAHPARLVAELLSIAFRRSPRPLRVTAFVHAPAQLLALLDKRSPDVVLLSADLGGGRLAGIKTLREIVGKHPAARVIVLLEHADRELVVVALRAGARGVFASAEGSVRELLACIHGVRDDQICVASKELPYALEAFATNAPSEHLTTATPTLTSREQSILTLIARGSKDEEIATRLGIDPVVVQRCIQGLLEKLALTSRFELMLYAVLQPPPEGSNTSDAA